MRCVPKFGCLLCQYLDTCQGDSGGLLMRFESVQRRWVLAGLASYGRGCGSPHYAGVYTRVATYIDWLRNIIGNDGLVKVEIDTSRSTKTSVGAISWSMNNSSSIKIASYSFHFYFSSSYIPSSLLNL